VAPHHYPCVMTSVKDTTRSIFSMPEFASVPTFGGVRMECLQRLVKRL